MVLCGVAEVQSQSITVDRQMRRYRIPRIIFINKLDRTGADPFRAVAAIQAKLGLTPVVLQYPIGLEAQFAGVIDLIEMTASYFEGEQGEHWIQRPIPDEFQTDAQAARDALLDQLSLYSEAITAKLLNEEEVPKTLIWETLR